MSHPLLVLVFVLFGPSAITYIQPRLYLQLNLFPPTPPSSLPTPSLHATSNWRETLPPRRNLLKINQGEVLDAHSTPRVSLWSPVHQQKVEQAHQLHPEHWTDSETTIQKLLQCRSFFDRFRNYEFRNYDRPIQKLFSTDSETIFDRFRKLFSTDSENYFRPISENYFPPIQKTIFDRFRNYFRPIQQLRFRSHFSTDSQNLDTRSYCYATGFGMGSVGWGGDDSSHRTWRWETRDTVDATPLDFGMGWDGGGVGMITFN